MEFLKEPARTQSKIKADDMINGDDVLCAIDRLFATKPRLAALLSAGLMVVLGAVLNVEEVFAAGVVLALLVCVSFVRKVLRAPRAPSANLRSGAGRIKD